MKRQGIMNHESRIKNLKFSFLFFILASCFLLLASTTALAQETDYKLLAPVPFADENSDGLTKASEYIPGMVKLVIAFAAVLAVVRIIIGGIQYMSTDALTGKSSARKTIEDAIWGFILIISSWLILNTVNPKLVSFDLKIERLRLGTPFDTDLGPTNNKRIPEDNASLIGCANCDLFPKEVDVKPVASGPSKTDGACAWPGPCVVNVATGQKLARLASNTDSDPRWIVSEAYPPTVRHVNTCQQQNKPDSGTCVDVSLISPRTADNINKFVKEAKKVGLCAVYEVPADTPSRSVLIKEGVNENWIISVRRTPPISEHFSVYNDARRNPDRRCQL